MTDQLRTCGTCGHSCGHRAKLYGCVYDYVPCLLHGTFEHEESSCSDWELSTGTPAPSSGLAMRSMSVSHGFPTDARHNIECEYRQGLANVDARRTDLNEVLVARDLAEMYQDLFGEALQAYNAKQKRDDRRIEDYLQKIRASKQEKPVYEMVVQIGNKDTNPATDEANRIGSSVIYRDFLEAWQKRFPQLAVQEAAIHVDEATPHLHVCYVPVSRGNKRGLETKNSLSGAYKQMGYQDVREANQVMFEMLQDVASRHGIDRLDMGCHRARLNLRDYKALANTIEAEGVYPYRDNPALVNLLRKQNELIEELIQENERCVATIDALCAGVDDVGLLGQGIARLREEAVHAKEASETPSPTREAARSAVNGFKTMVAEIPQWWRDNLVNPVSEALRSDIEVIER